MPDLLESDLVDALRRYGAATEAMAARYAAPPDYPVARPDRPARSEPTPASGRRRAALLVGAAAVVLFAIVAAVAVVRRGDPTPPPVDTPPSTVVVPTAEPFDDGTVLLWLPYEGPPQYLGQKADRPVPLEVGDPPQPGRGGIATVYTTAAFFVQGSLHLVDRVGTVTSTGVAGDRVIAEKGPPAFYVYGSGRLSRYELSEDRPDVGSLPSWPVPTGWELANDGVGVEVVDGRVILERIDRGSADHEIAAWRPSTGELAPIGRARWVVDASFAPDAVPTLAWLDDDCDPLSTGCGLVITNLDTMESRTVARPGHGFIGGGAFSDDGSRLAVFVAGQEDMAVDPSADLAVVDVGSLALRVLPGTDVPVGEPYGSAAWTLDNRSVIFHGLSETQVVDVDTGARRTLPWEITYSMATIP